MNEPRLHRFDLVLAVEIDPGKAVQGLPDPLERRNADELGIRLAADLAELLTGMPRFGLALVGALYDQTQILTPGFALFDGLADAYERSLTGGQFQARQMSIGASDGELGAALFEPRLKAGGGALLLLPLTALAPDGEAIKALAEEAESRFIEQGQVSPATTLALQQNFGVTIPHARFMTINDLCAMLRLQLEHIGLAELWDLLDAALFTPEQSVWTTTGSGNALAYGQGQVQVLFQGFDDWARHGGGAELGGEHRGDLGAGYAHYLRVQRQCVLSLEAHGVAAQIYHVSGPLPAGLDQWSQLREQLEPIELPFVSQLSVAGDALGPMQVTAHANDDLGTMAFTVEWLDRNGQTVRRENLFPVRPEGLRAIQARLEKQADGALEFAWPGRLCYDPDNKTLTGDPELANAPPMFH
jgi:hypothetical protein